jgi:hypothetical protein
VIKKEELIKITRDQDFINSPKHDNSLKKFMDQNPDGASDSVICKALCMSQKELDETYQCAILKLREGMTDDE